MAELVHNFTFFASQNQLLAFIFIYAAVILLGNIAGFSALWLSLEGVLGAHGFLFAIITLLVADVTGDLLWYSLGRALRDTRFGPWAIAHIPYHNRIEAHLHRNARKWIFLSKFIYASTFPIIFSAGWVKIEFKKFFRTSLTAIFLWTPLLSLISYGLYWGISPLRAQSIFHHFEYLIALGIVAFLVVDAFLSKIVEKMFARDDEG